MPQFMTIHRAPGLPQEAWAESSVGVYKSQLAKFVQAHVNFATGFIFTIFEADNQERLIEAFEEFGFPYEEINEVHFSQSFAEMVGMLKEMGRI